MIPTPNLGREPVAIITAFIVSLGALNTQVSGLSPTVHALISAALVVLGAIVARAAVTPAAARPALMPTLTLGEAAIPPWQASAPPGGQSVAELLFAASQLEATTAPLAAPPPAGPAYAAITEPGPAVSA